MGRRKISSAEKRQRQEFGKLLKQRRDSLGLTLGEAARRADLDHTTLSRIESGQRPTAPEYLDGLEKAYQVPWQALQIARSSQIPLPLKQCLWEPPIAGGDMTVNFSVRVTPEQKQELTLFLGYLRFKEAGHRSSKMAKTPITELN